RAERPPSKVGNHRGEHAALTASVIGRAAGGSRELAQRARIRVFAVPNGKQMHPGTLTCIPKLPKEAAEIGVTWVATSAVGNQDDRVDPGRIRPLPQGGERVADRAVQCTGLARRLQGCLLL